MEEEYFFICPYCWADISMILDLSMPNQEYVEDCEVCCNPIAINYISESGRLIEFDAKAIQ